MSTHENISQRGQVMEDVTESIIHDNLWIKILFGMIFGIVAGLLLSPYGGAIITADPSAAGQIAEWIALPGKLFLGLIQMVVIPLVICSIILGINSSRNLEFVKNISIALLPYFLATTALAVSIGIFLVQWIRPGDGFSEEFVTNMLNSGAATDTLPDYNLTDLTIPQRLLNLLPTNIAQAELDRNMLQIVVASALAGVALLSLPERSAEPLIKLSVSVQMLTMKIIGWAMHIAPYAVFSLLCDILIRTGFDALGSIGLYFITVLAGLACVMVMYMLIAVILGKRSLFGFLGGIREAQLIAFSTSSSGATMPVSISVAEEHLRVKPSVSRFVVPLGATINMDGTALYQAVAALFLCQVFGIELGTPEILLLLITTIGASIGTPATPGVGIVVLATILSGIGVPPEGIALILGVDRLLDMCRTTVNVTGDLTACVVMDRFVS
ncbi:MAG: dicarboxylate/amino acid:cation symporter [Rhodospirillales bacterium]|nr:dicarboxylate/amino acid:cation symporter [Rhodospirillales bacterium]MCB9972999.1 dicarboxylate/amino acid:cation symporter [Rhodospirillales bacterium]MCB9980013.1 dicarboxylate/amino acid:cation symporter [Rhodospirillales bacterium]